MKLHLPIALLAAIVSSQFAVAASTTQASANASGVTFDNSNPGHANVTISANAGDLTGYYMYGTYGNSPVAQGIIGAAASSQDTDGNAPFETFKSATVTMNGGKLDTLSGYGVQGNAVKGDTTVIMNGGSTELIVGGTAYTNGANREVGSEPTSADGWSVSKFTHKSNYGKEDDDTIQKQNINIQVNGGTVGQIRGTHSGHSHVHLYTGDGYLTKIHEAYKAGNTAPWEKYMQSNPLALSGNVNIDVNGGSIIAKNAGASETVAIYGGGGTGFSVDGSVNIAVGGDAYLDGDIIAGSSNNYTFVGSTNTVISGGSIKGNVYGGGDGSDPKSNVVGGQAPLVKNGTTVVLSGGTIDGNVYAAGLNDKVNGGTNVVIKNGGTKVTGTISGMGVDSDVNGERLLSIENSGGINVSWNQFQDFNAVEFKNSEIEFGTLSKDFEKVSAEDSWLQGSFEDGKVQLNANNSWLEIAGDLTTTKDSSITNTKKPMTVGGDATFQGTKIENADLVAGGDMDFEGSSMNGGSISVGGKLSLLNSDVKAQVATTDGSAVLVGSVLSDLTVDGSIKLADGSSFTGVNYDQVMPGYLNKMSTVTADSIEIGNNLHSDYSSFTATEGGITIGSGASLKHSHLNAKGDISIEQATLYASDTPEGYTPYGSSEVTSSEGNISIGAGSTLTNTDLTAEKGSVNLTSSTMNGGNIVAGESVVINDSKVTSTTLTAGDIDVTGSTLSNMSLATNKGTISIADSTIEKSDVTVNGGILSFGSSLDTDSVVSLNGTAVENNGGTIHAYSKIEANDGSSITATAGATHFHEDVVVNGSTITAQGGAAMHFDEKVVLDGSKVTTLIDSSNSQGVIKFHNDVEASGTVFEVIGGSGLTFEGDVVLNGDNKFIVNPGDKGYYNRNFSFLGDTVTANGTNLISGGVTMGANTVLTANGELYINANGGSSSSAPTSTLTNLQMGENGKINVTATLGYLKMTGNASITNLNLNGVWGSTISGNVNVADKVTIIDKGNDSLDITSTGSLKTSKFESTSGVITNSGSLTVNNSTTLTDSTLINKKGTTTLKGEISALKSDLVSTGGEINMSGAVVAQDSTFYAHGGNINFRNEGKTLLAQGDSSFIVDKGVIRFGSQYNHNGLITSEGATFEAIKNSYSDNSVMYFHSAVDADKGTEISALGGTMYFERLLDVEGSTITSGKSDAGISGKIYLKDDVIAKDTDFIIDGGSDISFEGNVELKGGNTLAVTDGNSKYFTFAGEKVTVNGDNTISGGLTMGKNTVLTAESGVLTIESAPKIKENGSYNPQNLRLNNLQIAENAAEGTEINVTANRGQLSIGGDSTVNNLSINRATTELSGNLDVDDMEIYSTRTEQGFVSGTVDFKGAEGTVANIGDLVFNAKTTDAEITHSGDGTVNIGKIWNMSGNSAAMAYEFKQTGNGELNFDADYWYCPSQYGKITQTGKGNININVRSQSAAFESVTQSGGGTVTVDVFGGTRIDSLDISNGSTFEAMCSVTLDEVAISDATLFNAGSMTMDSLVMDNATLLFAVSSFDDASSMINYTGADLTGYRTGTISAADMIQSFGVVMSGADAAGLLQQWGSEVEFSFTLAKGSDLFEKEFAYVLEQNLAEFTITLGDAAELSFADGEIKDITVEDTENGVVVKGIAVIPEPTTATLSLLALAALAARRRRR